jgi:bifunctional DNase/RNase
MSEPHPAADERASEGAPQRASEDGPIPDGDLVGLIEAARGEVPGVVPSHRPPTDGTVAGGTGAGGAPADGAGDDGSAPSPVHDEPVVLDAPDAGPWRLAVVVAVEMVLPSQFPEVVLQEKDEPWREVRIPVGLAEGTAIAHAWRGVTTPRPLTHALFAEVIQRHDVRIEAVRITARRQGTFLAELATAGRRGTEVVPCRPSDGIALMLRQTMPTPLLVAEWLFASAEAT